MCVCDLVSDADVFGVNLVLHARSPTGVPNGDAKASCVCVCVCVCVLLLYIKILHHIHFGFTNENNLDIERISMLLRTHYMLLVWL